MHSLAYSFSSEFTKLAKDNELILGLPKEQAKRFGKTVVIGASGAALGRGLGYLAAQSVKSMKPSTGRVILPLMLGGSAIGLSLAAPRLKKLRERIFDGKNNG